MIVEVVGWRGEHPETRLYDLPDAIAQALEAFVSSAQATAELLAEMEALRVDYSSISATPLSELDRYYRARLSASYIWKKFAEWQLTPILTLEFPLQ